MRRAKHKQTLSDTARWTMDEESKAQANTFRHSEMDDG